jgi:hypothetical protein
MRDIKIRFHLGSGENYMKWRIEFMLTKTVVFLDPEAFTIVMYNSKLYNQKSTAKKIHSGANKTVCAWIMADKITIHSYDYSADLDDSELIRYNPSYAPNWITNEGVNIDGYVIEKLHTNGIKLFI